MLYSLVFNENLWGLASGWIIIIAGLVLLFSALFSSNKKKYKNYQKSNLTYNNTHISKKKAPKYKIGKKYR